MTKTSNENKILVTPAISNENKILVTPAITV